MKSSSLTIRNSDGEIIGSMGLNFDLSSFVNIKEFLEMFTETFALDNLPKREEFFMWSVKDEIQQALNKYIASHDLQGKVLNRKDKLNVVGYMKKEGHTNKKGHPPIKRGDKVIVQLGYDGNLQTRFVGFVRSPRNPN